eukprot:NODE_1656_length_804_cov_255.701987_g1287_i0.p1 GENE.NODE_1656_length_804_cov_255.701987_g1287_i0~~NODE_1656_length_804_cov_255.701987_g1287_i0.p1  ORF type:complete len:130 (-),score=15.30 NODE_1656_length_804_cov_255.701987_g1287_i0:277-666(-)
MATAVKLQSTKMSNSGNHFMQRRNLADELEERSLKHEFQQILQPPKRAALPYNIFTGTTSQETGPAPRGRKRLHTLDIAQSPFATASVQPPFGSSSGQYGVFYHKVWFSDDPIHRPSTYHGRKKRHDTD